MVPTATDAMPVFYHVDCTWASAIVVQLADELRLGPDRLRVRTVPAEALAADAGLASVNPLRRLPALLLPSGTVVVETGAIVALLLATHAGGSAAARALLPPLAAPADAHARALIFLHRSTATAVPLMRDAFQGTAGRAPGERDAAALAAAAAAAWAATVAALVSAALADGRRYLLGDTYTVADGARTHHFWMVCAAGMDVAAWGGGDPRVVAWVDRLAARPSARTLYAPLVAMATDGGPGGA